MTATCGALSFGRATAQTGHMEGTIMPSSSPVRWQPRDAVAVPASASSAKVIVPFARQLTTREQGQLVKAFDAGLYEMGANFVWSRTMAGLKTRLAALGME